MRSAIESAVTKAQALSDCSQVQSAGMINERLIEERTIGQDDAIEQGVVLFEYPDERVPIESERPIGVLEPRVSVWALIASSGNMTKTVGSP